MDYIETKMSLWIGLNWNYFNISSDVFHFSEPNLEMTNAKSEHYWEYPCEPLNKTCKINRALWNKWHSIFDVAILLNLDYIKFSYTQY